MFVIYIYIYIYIYIHMRWWYFKCTLASVQGRSSKEDYVKKEKFGNSGNYVEHLVPADYLRTGDTTRYEFSVPNPLEHFLRQLKLSGRLMRFYENQARISKRATATTTSAGTSRRQSMQTRMSLCSFCLHHVEICNPLSVCY